MARDRRGPRRKRGIPARRPERHARVLRADGTGAPTRPGVPRRVRRVKVITENYLWRGGGLLTGGVRVLSDRLSADLGLVVPLHVMTRVFDAPRRLVFEAWTNPEHLPHWMLGPEGWTMPVCEIDLRPGGAWHFVWRRSDGTEMGMRGAYHEHGSLPIEGGSRGGAQDRDEGRRVPELRPSHRVPANDGVRPPEGAEVSPRSRRTPRPCSCSGRRASDGVRRRLDSVLAPNGAQPDTSPAI